MAKDHARLQGHLQLCSDPSYTAVSLVKKAVMGWGWDDAGWNDGTGRWELHWRCCSGDAGKVAWLARSVPRRVGLAWPWVHYVEILFPYILMSQEI